MAQAPQNPIDNPHMSWTASADAITELLNLSKSINVEGEITPVEAWHILKAHPNLHRFGKQGVDALKGQLSAHVRCEGYACSPKQSLFGDDISLRQGSLT